MEELGLKQALDSITTQALLQAILLVVFAGLIIFAVQKLFPRVASKLGGKPRLYILASVPLIRLLIIVGTIILVVPTLVKPSVENMIAIFGALGLALGFAFKDYANSLIAGIVILYEMPYRPGDWVEVDGRYGEVRSIGTRAAELVTPDDTVIVVPHGKLWDALIANSNDGTDHLLCVAEFHLEPNHDMEKIMVLLRAVAFTHPLAKTWRPVVIVVSNQPWGMVYRLKAYPVEPCVQFRFISELTAAGAKILAREGVNFVSAPVVRG